MSTKANALTCTTRRAADALQQQRCKVCWHADRFNFHVPDDVWASVVPPPFRERVVCLACFDRFACEAEIDYTESLDVLCFVGDGACLELEVSTRHWTERANYSCINSDGKRRCLGRLGSAR